MKSYVEYVFYSILLLFVLYFIAVETRWSATAPIKTSFIRSDISIKRK